MKILIIDPNKTLGAEIKNALSPEHTIEIITDLKNTSANFFDLVILNNAVPTEILDLVNNLQTILKQPKNPNTILKIGALSIDTTKQMVRYKYHSINVPRRQYMLLEYLVRHQGQVVTRSTIMNEIWDMDINIWSNTLEAHICELRKALQNASGKKYIHTIPGRGYKFLEPS